MRINMLHTKSYISFSTFNNAIDCNKPNNKAISVVCMPTLMCRHYV